MPRQMTSPSPFLPSSPVERTKHDFVRSDAPSPTSSFDGPRYVKELFEVIAPEISFAASDSPKLSDQGSPSKAQSTSAHSCPQLNLDLNSTSDSEPIPRSTRPKPYTKKPSYLSLKPKSKSSLSISATNTHKTTDIPSARVGRATRALSSSLRDAQQNLATVITLREHQRAHAAFQTSVLQGLEADVISTAMEVEGKRNELEAVEAEMRVLKGASDGLKGKVEKRRVRLPLRPRNRLEVIEKAGWPINLNKPMTRSNSTTRTI